MSETLITGDADKIKGIHVEGCVFHIGVHFDRAEFFDVVGENAYVPWIALYKNNILVYKVNAAKIVSIAYDLGPIATTQDTNISL